MGGGGGSICTSSWGYEYLCTSTTPQFGLTGPSSNLIAFVNTSAQTTFTVWNYGGGTLTGTATAGAPFSIVSGGSYSLTPGKPQTITVQFSPTTSGTFSGTLHLVAGSLVNDTPFTASTLTVTPASLNYTAFVGSIQDQVLIVKNDAPASETITDPNAATVTVSTSTPYSIVGSSSVTIRGQSTATVTIRYAPTAIGTYSGSVHLSGPSSMDLSLAGTTYQLSLNPAQPSFSAFVGNSVQQQETLTNTGTGAITLTASMTAPFSVVSPPSAFMLQPGGSQIVTVQFSPTTSGTFSGNLHVVGGGSNKDFTATATAYQMSVTPTSLVFTGFVGSPPITQNVNVTNTGTNSLTLTPSTSAPFSITSPSGSITLAPSQTQVLVVNFAPTTSGSFTGTIRLAIGSLAQNVAITSTAYQLATDPPQLNFLMFVGTSADQQVKVTNTGGNTVSLTATTTTSAPFSIISGSSFSLSPSQSQQVTVRANPTTSGAWTGTALLSPTGSTSSLSVPLAATAHKVSLNPAQLNFTSVVVGDTTEQQLILTNTGTTTLTLTPSTSAPFSITSPSGNFTLAPGAAQQLVARFSPTAAGTFSGSVQLASDAGSLSVPVTATAYTLSLSVSPTQLNFVDLLVGDSVTQNVTVTNTTAIAVTLTASTSAPFSIVAPIGAFTLDPNQSQNLTLKFNPTESGQFTGNARLTSGSNTINFSVVGAANMLSVDESDLFFLKLVQDSSAVPGATAQRKLIVGNIGANSLSFTVSIESDSGASLPDHAPPAFSIASSNNSFTLAPNQNEELTIQFNPTAMKSFQAKLRLTSGGSSLLIPLSGVVMTYDSYFATLLQMYNISVDSGANGIMYAQKDSRAVFMTGFRNLTRGDIDNVFDNYDQFLSPPHQGGIPADVQQGLDILNSINSAQMDDWLWGLVLADRSNNFEEEYATILPLGFDQVVHAMQLIHSTTADQTKTTIYDFIHPLAITNTTTYHDALLAAFGSQQPDIPILSAAAEIIQKAITDGVLKELLHAAGLADILPPGFDLLTEGASQVIALVFFKAVGDAMGVANSLGRDGWALFHDIEDILNHLKLRLGEGGDVIGTVFAELWLLIHNLALRSPSDQLVRLVMIHTAKVSIVDYGWDLVSVNAPLGPYQHIGLVFKKGGYVLEGSNQVVTAISLINVYDCGNTSQCAQAHQNILIDIQSLLNNLQTLLKDNNAQFGIVGAMLLNTYNAVAGVDLTTLLGNIAALVNQYEAQHPEIGDEAVFVVWKDFGGRLWFECFGRGCSAMSKNQRRREACRIAGVPSRSCGANEWGGQTDPTDSLTQPRLYDPRKHH